MKQFDRITMDPNVMGGKACIRGMRVTVSTILGLLGAGHSMAEVLQSYPYLREEDVLEALCYASLRIQEREVILKSK